MDSQLDPLYELFIEDLSAQLTELMDNLVILNQEEANEDAAVRLLRVIHSLKGIFYTVEMKAQGDVFHLVEALFKVSGSHFTDNPLIMRLLFDLHSELETFLGKISGPGFEVYDLDAIKQRAEKLIEQLQKKEQQKREMIIQEEIPPRQALYLALKATELKYLELIDQKGKPEEIEALLEGLMNCSQYADDLGDKRLIELLDGTCHLITDYVQYQGVLDHIAEGLIVESLDFAAKLINLKQRLSDEEERELQVHIDMLQPQRLRYLRQITDEPLLPVNGQNQRLGEILISQGKIDEHILENVMFKQKQNGNQKLGAALLESEHIKLKDLTSALTLQEKGKERLEPYTYVRVPEQKVDVLVDGMEELMILQSQLKEKLRRRWLESDVSTRSHLDQIDRMLIMLQHQANSFRMTTLEQTFKKAELVGRNTAKELLKEIHVKIEGSQVEADRSVVERLQTPIMHLVRNAVYHGIERSSSRERLGKPRIGNLCINAWIDEEELSIEVNDDGQGLDLPRIVEQARFLGLAAHDKHYSEWEIMNFIFEPGFSTNTEIDAIAGRGIGMNIVESEIKSLGGHIEIQNRPQLGVSFVLKVPVHACQMEGILVRIDQEKFIIPMEDIVGVYKAEHASYSIDEPTVVKLDGVAYPLSQFNEWIHSTAIDLSGKDGSQFVLISNGEARQAIWIDAYLMTMSVYVNHMNHPMNHSGLFKGVAVINEREFALILDVASIFSAKSLFEATL